MRRPLPTLLLLALLLPAAAPAADDGLLLIRDARVFDGERLLDASEVLVRGDTIVAVGHDLSADGAQVVDAGQGLLMPGFIDAHTHTWDGAMLDQAARFGVTTTLDMFTSAEGLALLRAADRPGRCDLLSAGVLATAPGGHGTQFGMAIPTITAPEQAPAFVRARVAEGSDFLKIVYDDGHSMGMRLPTVSLATLTALVQAAHAEGLLALVHVHDHGAALEALEAGADGLVHTIVDELPAGELASLAAARGAFVVPTLAVIESVCGQAGGAALSADEHLAPYLLVADRQALETSFPAAPAGAPPRDLGVALRSVAELRDAGVPVLAGTDAPNPGTLHGASMHRELELLVQAGLTPVEALNAATAAAADAFGLDDRGRIAPGLRADLVLVVGDPTRRIQDSRALVGVWQRGVAVERASLAAAVAAEAAAPGGAALPRLVSDFEREDGAPSFGMAWAASTDAIMGGRSTAELALVDSGDADRGRCLEVTGELVAGSPSAWSGALWCPSERPFQPVDLSSRTRLSFWAQGQGRPLSLMLFASSAGRAPVTLSFVAGEDWSRYEFELSRFDGIDPAGLTAVLLGAGDAGTFRLRLDDLRLE